MLGPDTFVAGGQRYAVPQSYMYSPMGYGPQTQGVPMAAPTIPPVVGSTGNAAAAAYGLPGTTGANAQAIRSNPFSPKSSPLVYAVAGLLFAWLMLAKVHYRSVVNETAHVGPVHESAGA
jgi:hypothetical protein